ncbi:MAG: hypothetical protein WA888_18500 [Burkholderiaceae bacterium]
MAAMSELMRSDWLDSNERPAIKQSSSLMKLIAESGRLEIRDRFYHLRRYPDTFLGSELVDLLTDEFDIGRLQAIRIGQRLLALELISHANGEHDFKDAPLFYVIGNTNEQETLPDLSVSAVRDLTNEMHGEDGIIPGVRRRWFVDYPMCFSGREVVDWVAAKAGVSREEAIVVGRAMLHANLIRHVLDNQSFRDGNHFYRFV